MNSKINYKDFLYPILYILLTYGIYYLGIEKNISLYNFSVVVLPIGFILFTLYIVAKLLKFNLRKNFLIISLTVGLIFMITTPMFRGADEELHFYRAYEISKGHIISEYVDGTGGCYLPKSLEEIAPSDTTSFTYEDLAKRFSVPLNKDDTKFIEFPTAALYSPVQYLPQSFGILVGRLMNLNPIYIAYLGRLFNLLIWIMISYFALKNLRSMGLIYVILMLPMTIHTATTLSADAFTNALTLLFISYTVRISYFEKDKSLKGKQIFFIYFLAVAISLCKIVYFPLCLIFLIVPLRKFKTSRLYSVSQFLIIVTCFIVSIGWIFITYKFLIEVNPGVNASEQIRFILTNPIRFILILFNTTSTYLNMYLHSLVGGNLCLFDVPIHFWISNYYLVLMLYLATHHNLIIPRKWDKIIAISVFFIIFILINVSLYVQWVPVRSILIEGIQGRYFMPLIPLLILMFKPKSSKNVNKLIITSSIFLIYPVIISLFIKHI